ncbi:MAG: ADP-forming succinate--CoA ligase subunit beta [Clostridium sp.]|nr:ADP-forming succinate--CoA ligase subunit beta [Clostridium sp.]
MKLFEYQGKSLFSSYGLKTPEGVALFSADEIKDKIQGIKFPAMVKAQILAGGRGKAGGVVRADDGEQLHSQVEKMLGKEIKGSIVEAVLVEQMVDFEDEYYISITMDARTKMPMLMFSACGGVDIEQVAASSPEKIARVLIDPLIGLQSFHVEKMCTTAGIGDKAVKKQLMDGAAKLYKLYTEYDAMVVEINPLMLLADHTILAADAKVEIDDSAVARHSDIKAWKDALKADPLVKEASDAHLLYIDVDPDGNVGVISNGSGMVMTCVDWIAHMGGQVACGLDLGGGATSGRVAEAIRIVAENRRVKVILISIFGGITRCNEISEGILKATAGMKTAIPIVVKLDGTNKEEGMAILVNANNKDVRIAGDIKEAASKAMLLQ